MNSVDFSCVTTRLVNTIINLIIMLDLVRVLMLNLLGYLELVFNVVHVQVSNNLICVLVQNNIMKI